MKAIYAVLATVIISFAVSALASAALFEQSQREIASLQAQSATFGVALPSGTAVFETSLASRITSSDTSMTLVSTSTASGEVLPSGYQCFTVDQGRTDSEYVCGTLTSAKTVTSLERGISSVTSTTTVAANQHAHRVGANVKITDFPLIQRMRAQLNGSDTIPNPIYYTYNPISSFWTSAPSSTLVTLGQLNDTSFAGVSNANESTKGIIELATQIEMASSTSLGSTAASLVLQSKYSTSSPYTTGLWNVITQNDGKISPNFIATSSSYAYVWGASHTFNAATTTVTNNLNVGTTTPTYGFSFNVGGSSILNRLSVGAGSSTMAAGTLQVSGLASSTNLTTSNPCNGCITGGVASTTLAYSAATAMDSSNGNTTSATATCASGKIAIAGGATTADNTHPITKSLPATNGTAWTVTVVCSTGIGTCTTGNMQVSAVCITP